MKSKTVISYENLAEAWTVNVLAATKYRAFLLMKTKSRQTNFILKRNTHSSTGCRHIRHREGAFHREYVPCTHLQALWTAETNKQNGEPRKKSLNSFFCWPIPFHSFSQCGSSCLSPPRFAPRCLPFRSLQPPSRGKFSGLP